MFASLPATLRWLFWFMIGIILVILVALVVHALGGFDLSTKMGHFIFRIGVT